MHERFSAMKKFLVPALVCGLSVAAMAEGEGGGGFDPTSLLSSASSTVSGIATAIGGVLTAAAAIYLAFIGWRKFREASNRI